MASLSDRLKSAQPNKANRNLCVTCTWLDQVGDDILTLINQWFDADNSIAQLHEILTQPSDDAPPLVISLTGFRFHVKHHDERWRR